MTCEGENGQESGRIGFADRATQASPEAPTGLRHSVSVPCADELRALAHDSLAMVALGREQAAGLADRIDALCAALETADSALSDMQHAWIDYHDAHSLTEPVTGRAGNAFDRAADARDVIDAALAEARRGL